MQRKRFCRQMPFMQWLRNNFRLQIHNPLPPLYQWKTNLQIVFSRQKKRSNRPEMQRVQWMEKGKAGSQRPSQTVLRIPNQIYERDDRPLYQHLFQQRRQLLHSPYIQLQHLRKRNSFDYPQMFHPRRNLRYTFRERLCMVPSAGLRLRKNHNGKVSQTQLLLRPQHRMPYLQVTDHPG